MAGIAGKSGGKRIGAGRKPQEKVRKQIRISADVLEHLERNFGNKDISEVYELAYRSAFNLPKQSPQPDDQ